MSSLISINRPKVEFIFDFLFLLIPCRSYGDAASWMHMGIIDMLASYKLGLEQLAEVLNGVCLGIQIRLCMHTFYIDG